MTLSTLDFSRESYGSTVLNTVDVWVPQAAPTEGTDEKLWLMFVNIYPKILYVFEHVTDFQADIYMVVLGEILGRTLSASIQLLRTCGSHTSRNQ